MKNSTKNGLQIIETTKTILKHLMLYKTALIAATLG